MAQGHCSSFARASVWCNAASATTEGGFQQGWSHHQPRMGAGHTAQGLSPAASTAEAAPATSHLADLHPVADYKCFNSSNVSIRTWSWNYRSCWHQTCPPVDSHHCVCIASIASSTCHKDQRNCCSSLLPRKLGSALGNLRACCPPW